MEDLLDHGKQLLDALETQRSIDEVRNPKYIFSCLH